MAHPVSDVVLRWADTGQSVMLYYAGLLSDMGPDIACNTLQQIIVLRADQ